MAVILNMIPVDQKQNTVLQNANIKDCTTNRKSENGFAKALNSETNKSEINVDSKLKSNDTMQLMTAMAGMVVPVVVNLQLVNQVVGNTADALGRTASVPQVQLAGGVPVIPKAQLTDGVPVIPKTQLADGVPVIPQVQLADAVPVIPQAQSADAVPVIPQVQLADAVPVIPQVQLADAVPVIPQVQLANAVPVIPQAQLADAVPVIPQVQLADAVPVIPQVQLADAVPIIPQVQLADAVPVIPQVQLADAVPVIPQAQLADRVPVMPQVQLANGVPVVPQVQLSNAIARDIGFETLLSQKTADTQTDNTHFGKFAELQAQTQLQMQNKPILGQVEVTEISIKNTEMLTNDPISSNITPSLTTMGNTNILGKNANKHSEGKKIVIGQINTPAIDVANNVGLVEIVDVKTVVAPQVAVAVVDKLLSENKENTDVSLPNQEIKNSDIFASMLNQQGMKVDNQNRVEVKTETSQPVADSYNITSQIVDQARLVPGLKNTEMIIKLKPEHLGELTFKVTVENGVISASFHSNNTEVRSLIESSLYQLKQELSNQGLKIDNVGVYAGLGQFFSNGQQSGNYQQPVITVPNKKAEEEFLDVFESTGSNDRALDGTGVDYRA